MRAINYLRARYEELKKFTDLMKSARENMTVDNCKETVKKVKEQEERVVRFIKENRPTHLFIRAPFHYIWYGIKTTKVGMNLKKEMTSFKFMYYKYSLKRVVKDELDKAYRYNTGGLIDYVD